MMRIDQKWSSGFLVVGVFLGLLILCIVLFRGCSSTQTGHQSYLRERLRIKALNFFMPSQYKDFANALENGQVVPGSYEVYYKVATEFMPSDFAGHYLLGLCYQSQGRGEQAEEAYRKSLHLYPGFFWTYYNIGVLYWQMGQKDLAFSVWSTALKVPPQATAKAFLTEKLLNDCVMDLKAENYDPGQHLQKAYEDLARWVGEKQAPEDLHVMLF
ncbi:MAG: tetratricopeptide repeat protein [Candidatus Omnitrophica bacterium]|nr:tetratricopeptide repeat protein [Candidatus Omnitrophota bacterium]